MIPVVAGPDSAWERTAAPAPPAAPGRAARIVGGEPAPPGAWPDVVALHTGAGFTCMGTLVTPRHVLTAGHCGYGLDHASVGGDGVDDGVRIGIADVRLHDDLLDTLDLAVLELEQDVVGTAPRTFAAGCAAGAIADGAPATIVGFGATDEFGSQFPDVLHQAETTIRLGDCDDPARDCNPAAMPGGELVAGGDGVDSCGGDSGGPLFVALGDETLLAGITSRAALPTTRPCGDGGIYVRADAAAAWLDSLGIEVASPTTCPNLPPRIDADGFEAAPGAWVGVSVAVADPDPGDVVSVDARAERGRIAIVEGGLWYRAPVGSGEDRLTLDATDDGDPPATTTLTLPIRLTSRGAPRGCATAPAGGLGLGVLAVLLGARRAS